MRICALDLGTNTFLSLIVEVQSGHISKVLSDDVETVRLGEGLSLAGNIQPSALRRSEDCLKKFVAHAKSKKVERIVAVATSAARDAKNSSVFVDIVEKLGVELKVISGNEEANLTFGGSLFGMTALPENILVLDIGGGSTEFAMGTFQSESPKVEWAESLNLGGVRLREKFIQKYPVPELEFENLIGFVRDEMIKASSRWTMKNPFEIVAVGGTPTSIASLDQGGFNKNKMHGYVLDREKIEAWQIKFAASTIEEKEKWGLGKRADIILVGTTILVEALKLFHKGGCRVSTGGIRYGLAQLIAEEVR